MLPHGYVRYINHLGTDQTIVEAARVSYKAATKGEEADHKLLDYLYKNRHTSPFEQCNITFNIKFPIFLMRQFVRHRTFKLNEVSARYTKLPDEFFVPMAWRRQNTQGNKQGSYEENDNHWQITQTDRASYVYEIAYKMYCNMIADGVAQEQARIVLPVGIYTEIYVNCDLHNLLHFFRLRSDPHAQQEMREVALAMMQITRTLFPWTMQAYSRYRFRIEDIKLDP